MTAAMDDSADVVTGFSLEIPEEWFPLAPSESDQDSIGELADGLPEEIAHRLLQATDAVASYAYSGATPSRQAWAIIVEPGTGRIDAVATLDFFAASRGAAEYAAAAEDEGSGTSSTIEVVNRTVTRDVNGIGEVVSVHDFTLEPTADGEGIPALERALIAQFPSAWPVLFELVVSTQDLTLFDDITRYAREIGDSLTLSRETSNGSETE